MTELPTPNISTKMKRPLVGGLLSVAGVLGITVFASLLGEDNLLESVLEMPTALLVLALFASYYLGYALAHFIKSNVWAILAWLFIVPILGPALFMLIYINFIFN